ncbi:hypothetical protein CYMTET_22054 [Cymbomonas tetramitiformis]|uniref:Uncharacterized protein n=1 Tax=Cymbomonas tetramitiformis TaxID=36881 RepID=A0AAE0L2B0_9CHLO|nr:hypothetical protein CYMTET_22054 [Cymbomonas tetramitiformis]
MPVVARRHRVRCAFSSSQRAGVQEMHDVKNLETQLQRQRSLSQRLKAQAQMEETATAAARAEHRTGQGSGGGDRGDGDGSAGVLDEFLWGIEYEEERRGEQSAEVAGVRRELAVAQMALKRTQEALQSTLERQSAPSRWTGASHVEEWDGGPLTASAAGRLYNELRACELHLASSQEEATRLQERHGEAESALAAAPASRVAVQLEETERHAATLLDEVERLTMDCDEAERRLSHERDLQSHGRNLAAKEYRQLTRRCEDAEAECARLRETAHENEATVAAVLKLQVERSSEELSAANEHIAALQTELHSRGEAMLAMDAQRLAESLKVEESHTREKGLRDQHSASTDLSNEAAAQLVAYHKA